MAGWAKHMALAGTFAGVMMAAAMSGVTLALPSNAPRIPLSPEMREKDRRTRTRAVVKARRRRAQRANHAANQKRRRARRAIPGSDEAVRYALFNGMTNWQASQYARAGRPQGLDDIRRFADMPHRKAGAG